MNLGPSARQQELIARARTLALDRFAPRAAAHDRDATFPFDDYADMRAEGFLGFCVPEKYGGLGADYETYCLVAEQLAQGNASTSLTFNMHCLTMLMMGVLADAMPMTAAARERHEKLRAAKFREVIEDGVFYGQPHSEPVEQGQTDTALSMGGRRFGTTARKVDGGYVINGRKFFVSLAGAAPYFATPAIRLGDEPWIERTCICKVPKDAPGVTFPGDWDPMGMRGTVSRDMVLEGRLRPGRRRDPAAGPLRRHVQRVPAALTADLLRDVPRFDAGRLRRRDRVPDRRGVRVARPPHRGRGQRPCGGGDALRARSRARPLLPRDLRGARRTRRRTRCSARAPRTSPCSAPWSR